MHDSNDSKSPALRKRARDYENDLEIVRRTLARIGVTHLVVTDERMPGVAALIEVREDLMARLMALKGAA